MVAFFKVFFVPAGLVRVIFLLVRFFDSEVVSLFSAVVDMHVCKHHVIAKLITIVYLTCRYPFWPGMVRIWSGQAQWSPPCIQLSCKSPPRASIHILYT